MNHIVHVFSRSSSSSSASSRRVQHFSLLVHPVEAYSSPKPQQALQRSRESSADISTGRRRSKSLPPPVHPLAQYRPAALPSQQLNARSRAQRDQLTWRPASQRHTSDSCTFPSTSRHVSSYKDSTLPDDWVMSQTELISLHATRTATTSFNADLVPDAHPISLSPPITKATLRELDLHEILRNPQLRHDSVFDPNLMFRPNYDGER